MTGRAVRKATGQRVHDRILGPARHRLNSNIMRLVGEHGREPIPGGDVHRPCLGTLLRVADPRSGARLCEAQLSSPSCNSVHRRPPRPPWERPPCEGRRGPSRRVCFAPCAELRKVRCAVGMLRPDEDDCISVFPDDWPPCGFCGGRERSSRRGEPECEVGKVGREVPCCSRRGAPD